MAGGIQDRKEFGTRVHEICTNHIVLIVMIVVLVVNIMLIVMTILLIHKTIFLIIVIKKCENGIENHDRKIPQRKTKFLSVCDELNLKFPASVTFFVGVDKGVDENQILQIARQKITSRGVKTLNEIAHAIKGN